MRVLLFVISAAIAFAQIKPNQLALESPPAAPTRPKLFALADGKFVAVTLDQSIIVSQTPNGYLLSVNQPSPKITIGHRRLTQNADGTYPAFVGSLFRNGVLQSFTIHYDIVDGAVKPLLPWSAADVVVALEFSSN